MPEPATTEESRPDEELLEEEYIPTPEEEFEHFEADHREDAERKRQAMKRLGSGLRKAELDIVLDALDSPIGAEDTLKITTALQLRTFLEYWQQYRKDCEKEKSYQAKAAGHDGQATKLEAQATELDGDDPKKSELRGSAARQRALASDLRLFQIDHHKYCSRLNKLSEGLAKNAHLLSTHNIDQVDGVRFFLMGMTQHLQRGDQSRQQMLDFLTEEREVPPRNDEDAEPTS